MSLHRDNVLVIADTHIPFEHKNYLEFCVSIGRRVKCGKVVHIGDLVDNHSISYHEHDPNGLSPIDEIKEAKRRLSLWFKAFPKLFLCRGNHDRMVDRKGRTTGLPDNVFKPFRDIWELPLGWHDAFEFDIDGVRYFHGSGYSGDLAHMKAAQNSRQSSVIGHVHSLCACAYTASEKDCIFGMAVGSGIDRNKYAFAYEKIFPRKPIVSCGVVTDRGKYAQVFKMDM